MPEMLRHGAIFIQHYRPGLGGRGCRILHFHVLLRMTRVVPLLGFLRGPGIPLQHRLIGLSLGDNGGGYVATDVLDEFS